MDEKSLFVLACFDDDAKERLLGLEDEIAAHVAESMQTMGLPHITMHTAPVEQEEALTARSAKIARETAPFSVSFQSLAVFAGAKVLFAAPAPNAALLALKARFGEEPGWTPHNTLFVGEPLAVYRALPIAAERFSPFSATVRSLHLYEFFPARRIAIYELTGV